MITKFKTKYGIKSNYQLIVIFIVFGITGSTAAFISDPLMEFINIKKSDFNFFLYWTVRVAVITFVYQIILFSSIPNLSISILTVSPFLIQPQVFSGRSSSMHPVSTVPDPR